MSSDNPALENSSVSSKIEADQSNISETNTSDSNTSERITPKVQVTYNLCNADIYFYKDDKTTLLKKLESKLTEFYKHKMANLPNNTVSLDENVCVPVVAHSYRNVDVIETLINLCETHEREHGSSRFNVILYVTDAIEFMDIYQKLAMCNVLRNPLAIASILNPVFDSTIAQQDKAICITSLSLFSTLI